VGFNFCTHINGYTVFNITQHCGFLALCQRLCCQRQCFCHIFINILIESQIIIFFKLQLLLKKNNSKIYVDLHGTIIDFYTQVYDKT